MTNQEGSSGDSDSARAVSADASPLDAESVLLWRTGGSVTAVRPGPAKSGWTQVDLRLLPAVARQLFPTGETQASMRTFAMHPQDLRIWDQGVHHGSEGYSWATVWGADNKIDAQMRIKELQSIPAALDPLTLYTAVAVAQLQAQVEALTELVEGVAEDVKTIIRFLRIEQEADVLAAVGIIIDVQQGSRAAGRVTGHDWSRVATLEHVLLKQHGALLMELAHDADSLNFHSMEQAKAAAKIDPTSVDRRLGVVAHLLWALAQWYELLLASKSQSGELREGEAQEIYQRFVGHLEDTNTVVMKLCQAGGHIDLMPWWKALFTEGIVGRRKHEQQREAAAAARAEKVGAVARQYLLNTVKNSPLLEPPQPAGQPQAVTPIAGQPVQTSREREL